MELTFARGENDGEFSENKEVNDWIRVGLRLGVSATLHPIEYAKVLMQLGYEPIAPKPGRSILGKQIMVLPNVFQYSSYIRKTDGFYGCYRGLTPKLIGSLLSIVLSEKIADRLGLPEVDQKERDPADYIVFKNTLKRDIVLTVSGIIVAQPFHVISVRMMAQFIGRENLYSSLFGSIKEVYNTNGIAGFFSGLIPKLLCEVTCIVLTSSTVYLLNKYVIKDRIIRGYNAAITQFGLASILYPLNVVATCMAVTSSRLMAGEPPCMPAYTGWIDCWHDLQSRGELKRGSSLFWRSFGGYRPLQKTSYAPLPVLSRYQ